MNQFWNAIKGPLGTGLTVIAAMFVYQKYIAAHVAPKKAVVATK